jgi:cellobiose transport system substrate-binding protein
MKVRNLLVLVTGFALFASGFVAVAPANAVNKTIIKVQSFGDVMQDDLIAAYEKAHPDVDIQVAKSSMDNIVTVIQTQCLTGTGPDIVAIEIAYSGYFRSSRRPNCFTDLRTMNPSADTIKSQYLDWRWSQGVALADSAAPNRVIGIPTDVGSNAILYRVDLFKKAGLPTDRVKVSKLWPTWDKFIDTGKAYKLKTKKAFFDNSGTLYAAVLNQGTVKYYASNGSLVYKSNPQVKNAFNIAVKAMTTSFPASSKLSKDIGARISPFTSDWVTGLRKDAFATTLGPAWMMDYIKKNAPSLKGKWDIASIPGGGGNLGGSQLAIPSRAVNKQKAWDFLRWYLAPAQQLTMFKKHGFFPSTKTLYNDAKFKAIKDPFFNNAPVAEIYSKSALALKPLIEGEKQRTIDQIFGQALSRVARGAQSASQAWTQTMSDIDKALG